MQNSQFGIIGLGTMGRNLLLNIADHNFSCAGYDKNADQVNLLNQEKENRPVQAFNSLEQFISALQQPRSIVLLVPAGKIVDDVIAELEPLLSRGDIIVDAGNSYFKDTELRAKKLSEKGFHFFGTGVSGGEEGARKGPSMMPGGDKKAYEILKEVFEAIAAKVDDEPCVTYIGPGGAGHYVKMVHNGIEYALMQLIAETYEAMKKGLHLNNAEIATVYKKWNEGRLQSFLLEITADIFQYKNPGTDDFLVDQIKDQARSKGTGKWTSEESMELEVPAPIIDMAVSMRNLSKYKWLREGVAARYPGEVKSPVINDKTVFLASLESALYFATIITYAQGMHLLYKASKDYGYDLNAAGIAKIWRGGCIIRSAFLENIYTTFKKNASLEHLLLDDQVQSIIQKLIEPMRDVVCDLTRAGIAAPALGSALNYFDSLRTKNMPSSLIQAQRDYFGAHTYELEGKEGVFHTKWTGA
ncbi:MAG: hypothetical protein JWN76_2832 [Chitinophagaceae bacterium]|nr:hypothetical protein [Chitinophagaceae bacterium]